ncbi:helix-turn-helix domain-containing protein [Streptococcus merionis]|uniref:helix-turn-helix domain-containing protein n=1 Tax=Streptococcus merionis TaxID=400065 RepID=UPI003518161B
MNRLKELRKEKELTQQALSKQLGISYRTLQNWENGESQIKPDKAQALADYFGVNVGYLLGYEPEPVKNLGEFIKEIDNEPQRINEITEIIEILKILNLKDVQLVKTLASRLLHGIGHTVNTTEHIKTK